MKNPSNSPALTITYRFLLALVICLVLFFLAGTVYSIFFKQNNEKPVPTPVLDSTFTGIGRLRLPSADSSAAGQGSVVILSITFPYTPEDWAFTEELATRVKDFRSIAEEYFLSFSTADLKKRSEEQIKRDLLERYNRILRLGKIETLYFNDFMIVE